MTLSQLRYTGGLWLESGGKNILIDPGVGTLIRSLEFGKNLRKLDAIFVSHKHLDHYSDAEVCIEGMTDAMNKRRGAVFINENAAGYISKYHKDQVDFTTFSDVGSFEVAGIAVDTIPTFDHDNAFGFRFHLKEGVLTYASDTNYNDELIDYYRGSDLLILHVLRPDDDKVFKHLTIGEAKKIIDQARPKRAVLTHFGYELASRDMKCIAENMEKETGVLVIAAEDGMRLDL